MLSSLPSVSLAQRCHAARDGSSISWPQTVDALMKLDLAAGVDVEIKL